MSQFTPHHPALLRPYSKPANPDVIRIVRGKDALVFDDQGNQYIDGMGALWYCNIGHGRPEIGDAVAKQMSTLANYHCFEPFTSEPAEQLAERIKALAPVDNARVFLTSSGSEAVDSAMKLARISHVQAGRPERTLIVSRSRGYHGVTYGGLSAQGLPLNQAGFGPLLTDIINVPADDDEAMATVFVEHGEQIAAVITEPVQGAGGVYPPTDGYLATLRRLCDKHGAFLIFDEVICGFGRLGRWFGADYFGVRPDLMTFAKGVSSGYIPMGRGGRWRQGARRPRSRPRILAAPWAHLLWPRRGVGWGHGQHRHHRQRGDDRTRGSYGCSTWRRSSKLGRRQHRQPCSGRWCRVGDRVE